MKVSQMHMRKVTEGSQIPITDKGLTEGIPLAINRGTEESTTLMDKGLKRELNTHGQGGTVYG